MLKATLFLTITLVAVAIAGNSPRQSNKVLQKSGNQGNEPTVGSVLNSLPALLPKPPAQLTQGFSSFKGAVGNAAGNQINNVFNNAGEVVKQTDSVLTENGNQFNKITKANGEKFRQASRTVGTGLVKIPETGTAVLSTAEDIIQQPGRYLNPINLIRDLIAFILSFLSNLLGPLLPWAHQPTQEERVEQMVTDTFFKKLKDEHSLVYEKLMKNAAIHDWLRNHPKIYDHFLQNPQELEQYLDNPQEFVELIKALQNGEQQQEQQQQQQQQQQPQQQQSSWFSGWLGGSS